MSAETVHDYSFIAHLILPILVRFLQQPCDRNCIVRILELCTKICGVRENYDYLLNCPDEFLEILVDLLCYSNTSIEPPHKDKEPEKPIPSIGPYSELIDSDVRNGAIDTLNALCYTAPPLRIRIANVPHCMRILQRVVCLSDKREVSAKLSSFLAALAQQPELAPKFLAMQDSVFVASSTDDIVAGELDSLRNCSPTDLCRPSRVILCRRIHTIGCP